MREFATTVGEGGAGALHKTRLQRSSGKVLAKPITIGEKIRHWTLRIFPERQIYFRTNGIVRFLVVHTSWQIALALLLTGSLVWITYSSLHVLGRDEALAERNQRINQLTQERDTVRGRATELAESLAERASRIERRQQLLETLVENNSQISITKEDAVFPTSSPIKTSPPTEEGETAEPAPSMDTSGDLAMGVETLRRQFTRVEDRQNHMAEGLTRVADKRLAEIEKAIADTGLSVDTMVAAWTGWPDGVASGGPFIPTSLYEDFPVSDTPPADAFEEMTDAWGRVYRAVDVLASLPVVEPPADYYISSNFGRRRDPYRGVPAMHSGIDMAGWPGTKVSAAGLGRVVHAGHNGAYGNMVEIDHGNGFRTRYGHMRRLSVTLGDIIEAGQKIGEMGCTGRCTSTHLHFEVWFNGKPVNPIPYLKASGHVYKIQAKNADIFNLATED